MENTTDLDAEFASFGESSLPQEVSLQSSQRTITETLLKKTSTNEANYYNIYLNHI